MPIDRFRFRNVRESKGLSQTQLANLAGVGQTTIDKIERGETKSSRMLPKLAAALGVQVEELDTDAKLSGAIVQEPKFFSNDLTMPVFASAEGGNGSLIVSADPLEYIRRPHTLEAVTDAYAILIVGESMVPAFEPGDTAWVNPRLPRMRDTDAIFYSLAESGEAHATIKRLVSWSEGEWTVRQWNPAKTFKLERQKWQRSHRVVGKFSRR